MKISEIVAEEMLIRICDSRQVSDHFSGEFDCLSLVLRLFQKITRLWYTLGEVTSHICGRNTISILWGNTVVMCVVKWWRFVTLLEYNWVTTTIVLQPFFRDHPGELVPEENFWTLWCLGRLTEADTSTIWLGTTPSGLSSAHLHYSPIQ